MYRPLIAILISVLCISHVGAQDSNADACINGTTVSGRSGIIHSPNYPQQYPDSSYCSWNIQAPDNTKISVIFEVLFDIEGLSSCFFDYVAIFDGSNKLEFCSQQTPRSYLSSTNNLTIVFKSDSSISGSGFSLNWTAIDDTDIPDRMNITVNVNMNGGIIESDGYPNSYSSNLMTIYFLEASEGEKISLAFNPVFGIDGSPSVNCPYDFLEIYEGNATENSLLITLCGKRQPEKVYVESSQVMIVFQTDAANSDIGFSLRYGLFTSAPKCDSVAYINGTEGVITSSFYPRMYDASEKCEWFITAPDDKLIAVIFNLPFDLPLPFFCFDILQLYDGPSTSSPKIFSQDLCGDYPPRGFLTSSNFLTVVFMSSALSFVRGQGFSFNWTTEDACETNQFRCWTNNCIDSSLRCDGHVDCIGDGADEAECGDTNATTCGIASVAPNFPLDPRIVGGSVAKNGSWPWQLGLYENVSGVENIVCGAVLISQKWAVTAAHCIFKEHPLFLKLGDHDLTDTDIREQVIHVKASYMHPDYDFQTSNGFLYGHDIAMLQLNVPAIRTLWVKEVCLPPPNLMPIADDYVVVTGWGALHPFFFSFPNLLYQLRLKVISYEECNKKFKLLNEEQGIPNFNMPLNIFCIGLKSGGAGSCNGDSGGPVVEHINGTWVLTGLVSFGVICGTSPIFPSAMTRVSYFIPYIEGYLNGSAIQRNLQNISMSGNSGSISSPNYGSKYPQNIIMRWHITADADKRLIVRFNSNFHIEYGHKCTFDYLRIFDGNSFASLRYLNRDLCGDTAPPDFESQTNEIIVEFSSDTSFEYTGFSLTWEANADCTKDEYRCWNRSCIPLSQKCDNHIDCINMDDEIQCERASEFATCGVQEISPDFPWSPLLVGGHNAKEGSYPWHANIFNGEMLFCGGTLINSNWILTSVLCALQIQSNSHITLGDYNLATESVRQKTVGVIATTSHPNFTVFSVDNDVAVINLNETISFTRWIKPICLPEENSTRPPPGTTCILTGHGKIDKQSNKPVDILQQLPVWILSDSECLDEYKKINTFYNGEKVPDTVICARGQENRTALCAYDRGSPLQCLSNNRWKVYGIITGEFGCFENAVFVGVIDSVEWINETISVKQCEENEIRMGDSGVLTLPTFSGRYLSNTKCSWLIQASPNKLLQVRFNYFDVEDPCIFDYVAIHDGNSTDARRFLDEKLCGNNINIRNFESSTNAIFVTFKSDGSVQYRGFQLAWIAVDNCEPDEFRCLNQKCIPEQKKCDRVNDCADKSDEMQCKLEKQQCGTPDVELSLIWAQLIVGGNEVEPGTWPWHVGITHSLGTRPFCGGTLVYPSWVMTAAHCVISITGTFYVVVGEHDTSVTNDNAVYIPVNKTHVHPNYDDFSIENGFDIAILKLSQPATVNKYVQTLCIVNNGDVPVGEYCIATGWGDTGIRNPFYSPVLRQVRLRILDQEICHNITNDYNEDHLFCAGNFHAGGVDTCDGDSGGPVACLGDNSWYLLGITSFGIGCGRPGEAGFYVHVPFFYDWIKNIIDPPAPPPRDCIRPCMKTDASSSVADKMSKWVCELVNWRCGMSEWMSNFITWWEGCTESDTVALWQGQFTCPSNETFRCCSGEQICFRDAFRCNICHCVKGTYKYASRLINIWDKDHDIYQERVDFYNRYKDSCTQRDREDECPAGEG